MKVILERDTKIINDALKGFMAHKDNPQAKIYEAMEYSLFAGGKRLRPILMLECANMCSNNEDYNKDAVITFACAMEMLHTYSLIHDDLPAMDNDDLRRGMPTNHKKFGEATAILAGDALLNRAFELTSNIKDVDPAVVLRAISMLGQSSGAEGMIGGQVVDLESEGKKIELSDLQYIHMLKTGAIIRSSCKIGAALVGASEAQINAVDEFALNLGIAFQIQDDILDETGTAEELGKPIGSDREEQKNTYVTLLGLEKSEELVREYSQRAIAALKGFGDKADFLIELTKYLVDRKA